MKYKLTEETKEIRKEKAHLADELRHSNYKRCLAMAGRCHETWANISTPYQKAMWYRKWHERWLELAEEPTWAKFLQLIHKEAK